MITIGIICAMDSEFQLIKDALTHGETHNVGCYTFYVAEQSGKRIAAAVCGIGKVNAAACAQMLISHLHADYIINSGVSGALSPTLHIMDMVTATDVMYHDLDPALLDNTNGNHFPGCAIFPADERLSRLVKEICTRQNVPCLSGRVVTGDQFITDSAKKAQITAETQGITTEMEGAAIGHVCYLNAIPFAVVRCVSDGADDDAGMTFDAFVVKAAQRCAKITLELIQQI